MTDGSQLRRMTVMVAATVAFTACAGGGADRSQGPGTARSTGTAETAAAEASGTGSANAGTSSVPSRSDRGQPTVEASDRGAGTQPTPPTGLTGSVVVTG